MAFDSVSLDKNDFEMVSDTTLRTKGPYPATFNHAREIMKLNGGTIKKDDATAGVIEAAWRYGINVLGLRVTIQFRTLSDNQIEINVKGGFSDAVDTTGAGAKKAREITALIAGQSAPTDDLMPPRIGEDHILNRGKKKTISGSLAIFLGGLGVHKFYLGNWGIGIAYIASLFVIPYLSALVGLIEGIRLFTMNEHEFNEKYNYREVKPFEFIW